MDSYIVHETQSTYMFEDNQSATAPKAQMLSVEEHCPAHEFGNLA
jgi:hypothetical protein